MDEGAGWEQQQDNERRRYEEEREERVRDQLAWNKHWRETWERWANQHDKPKEQNNEVV